MASWNASRAKGHLAEIIDAAAEGQPQFIDRRDGTGVVVVSRAYFERTRPNLKTFLLENTYSGEGEEAFDLILRDIRGEGFDVLSLPPEPEETCFTSSTPMS
jgi:prevent-host-death family protein